MNTAFFDLDFGSSTFVTRDQILSYVFTIPTLPAYAIELSDLIINGIGQNREGDVFKINGNEIIIPNGTVDPLDKLRVIIHYHGIRDYGLLFPAINDPDLVNRLANFYEESEKNFNNGAWLSFALMCGAIYEGFLFDKLGNHKFNKLINNGFTNNLIDLNTKTIMHKTREFRNLVHANRFNEAYVSRLDAMDIKTTLDKLIKLFSI